MNLNYKEVKTVSIALFITLLTCTKSIFTNFYHLPNFYHFKIITTNFLTLYYFSSIKNGSILFFPSSSIHQSHHLVGCQARDNNSLPISLLHVMRCLNLLHQAISLT